MTLSMLFLSLVLLTTHSKPAQAERRRFDGPIAAASNYIHYSEGFVVTPGYVDISDLEFEAVSESVASKLFSEGVLEAEGDDGEYDDGEEYEDDADGARALEDASGGAGTVSALVATWIHSGLDRFHAFVKVSINLIHMIIHVLFLLIIIH